MPLPEDLVRHGESAERILRADAKQHVEAAVRQVGERLGIAQPLIVGQTNGLMLNTKVGEEHGVRSPDLRKADAEALAKIDYVEEALTYEDLIEPEGSTRGFRQMFRQSFHPDRAPDIAILYKENILVLDSRYGTTHGTPYGYDTHVPVILWGAGVGASTEPITEHIRTIDVAPTLAALLGLTPPSQIDGVILLDVIAESVP
jgi:hypothetical protein